MFTRRAALAAGTLIVAGAGPDGIPSWTIVTEYPATAIPGEGIAAFAAAVAEGLDRALTVVPRFDAPDGLRSAGMPAAVAGGMVTAADSFAPALAAIDPLFQLSALPFLTRSAADTGRLLELARPAYRDALAARGLALLYASPWPPTGLWSRRPLPDDAALAGLRVRTYDGASTAVLASAGARPEQISFADALPRLRDGSLDAVLSSGDGGAGARLWEALPHFTVLDYAFPLSLAFCDRRVLDALAPGQAEAVRRAAAATEVRQFAAMAMRVSDNEARMRTHGVAIADAPPWRDALMAAAATVVAAWADRTGPVGTDILARYRGGRN